LISVGNVLIDTAHLLALATMGLISLMAFQGHAPLTLAYNVLLLWFLIRLTRKRSTVRHLKSYNLTYGVNLLALGFATTVHVVWLIESTWRR